MVRRAYNVAIVGGGLVGASLACALAPLGLRVALIEAVALRAGSSPSYDDRTLALSASSCRILQSLGLWPELQVNATPIREIQVREFGRAGRVVLRPQELGMDRFGHVVEARVFGAAMAAALPQLPGLDLYCPASVSAIGVQEDSATVRFSRDSGETALEADVLVAADGANSFVRESLGVACQRHDYSQTAVICNITPEQEHRGRAFECFTPTGPFAVMPHVNGRCGLIWCEASERARSLLDLPEAEFLERANQRFGGFLGRFVKMGQRSSYPLRLVRALEDVRERVVLMGNAAHAIHPVGAQGFNLGLRDAAALAEVFADELRGDADADIGRMEVLRRYSNWRRPDQEGTVAWSDGLARLYSNASPAASVVRGLGLAAHALLPSIRRQMAVRAMGYRGRAPRLALGESL